MDKDSMSCAHSNKSRVVERLASRASEIESARCSSFRGVRNLTERKEFDPNFFRGLSAPIVGIFESTWGRCNRFPRKHKDGEASSIHWNKINDLSRDRLGFQNHILERQRGSEHELLFTAFDIQMSHRMRRCESDHWRERGTLLDLTS